MHASTGFYEIYITHIEIYITHNALVSALPFYKGFVKVLATTN